MCYPIENGDHTRHMECDMFPLDFIYQSVQLRKTITSDGYWLGWLKVKPVWHEK
jgi:hypothetical protein